MASTPILLIPMAGQGSRFKKAGILTPKQLLPVGDQSCLERSLNSFRNLSSFKIVFGIGDEQVAAAAAAYAAAHKLDAQIVRIGDTQAPTQTLQIMIDGAAGLTDDALVYVFTMDTELYPAINIDADFSVDGVTYVFTSTTPYYSYVKIEDGRITAIAEKKVISRHANIGLYGFRRFDVFKQILQQCEDSRRASPRETHVSDMIAAMLATHRFEIRWVEGVHCFGTPQEYDFYIRYVLAQRSRNRIALFADHSGFATKARFAEALRQAGFAVTDCGAFDAEMSNYTTYATAAVTAFERNECDIVMGFCRTGQGANIALNKLSPALLSAVIYDETAMEFALSHNCARGFCFPENIWLEKHLTTVVDCLREVVYEGGRHTDRLRPVVKRHLTPDNKSFADKLAQFKGGWMVGMFDPALVTTPDVEVGIKRVAKNNPTDGHYHKLATEYTVILEGKAEDQGRIFGAGDVITLRPLERNHTVFLEDSLILCIKAPSVTDDKYE